LGGVVHRHEAETGGRLQEQSRIGSRVLQPGHTAPVDESRVRPSTAHPGLPCSAIPHGRVDSIITFPAGTGSHFSPQALKGVFMKENCGFFLLACTVTLGGCAAQQYWVHPSRSQSEFHQDKYQCERDASQMYPAAIVQRATSPAVQIDNRQTQTNCVAVGNNAQCNSARTGGNIAFQQPLARTATDYESDLNPDANSGNRDRARQSCMYAKGWQLR
jgi:hypothetical protein